MTAGATAGPGRWRQLAIALLCACLIPLVAGETGAARAQTSAALPLGLTIRTLTPTAPQADELLTITGVVSNPTATPYEDLSVGLELSATPLVSRAALLAVAGDAGQIDGVDEGDPYTIDALPAGHSARYTLAIPVNQLALVTAGVYQISVEVFQSDPDGDRTYDARINTFLPWLPASADIAPIHVAWVWPLLGTPGLQPDNTFTDDSLGSDIEPRGRLGLLLGVATQAAGQSGTLPLRLAPRLSADAGTDPGPTPITVRPVPVTPVIDPENIQELELMADPTTPYVVSPPGGPATPGVHQADAATYLANLKSLMATTSSIAVPYADPDIEALNQAHALGLVTQARSTGLEAALPNVVAGLIWPPDGALSESTLDQLTASGLVLADTALPLAGAAPAAYTPTDVAAVDRPGGTVPAVVIDDGLSTLVTKPIHAGGLALAAQRYAAETAAIALEAGPASRTFVIAPDRRWSPRETAVRTLLDETGQLPWLTPETVAQALALDPPDPTVTRGPLQLPPDEATLPTGLADQIAATNAELAGFRSILCPTPVTGSGGGTASPRPTPAAATTAPVGTPAAKTSSPGTPVVCNRDDQVLLLQRSVYRAASTAFRKTGSGGEALITATAAELAKDESKVHIATKGGVELVGNRAKIAISIVNGLSVPVKVQLVLRSRNAALRIITPAEVVTLGASAQTQRDVTVRTASAGAQTLLVDAQLLTPDSRNFGPATTLRVRVSAYGAVVVTISLVVAGLLVLAVVVRIYRRIRNARGGRTEPTEPTEPTDGGPAEPAGVPA